MEAWFLSDIHLKTAEERNGKILLRFLRSLLNANPQQVHLFLVGDIFDLWVGPHTYFAKKFWPLMEALKDLKKAGAKITYIEGNHDVHVEGYFQKKLGVEVFVEAQHYLIDGVRVRVEHGDLINLQDEKYLKYRSIIRNPRIKPLGNILPGQFWDYIGNRASKKSRARTSDYANRNTDQLVQMIRDHAVKVYPEKPFDIIISGHMHVFDDHQVAVDGNTSVRSINLGSWFEPKVKVFRLKDGIGDWVYLPE
ncbi:UDP-2,3-diacylglucosamine hydrolase [Bdellovibrio bacteriovorus]|uniref:UDP-2,3-diacylglucosamine hydrolase n=1 Tax=Bdellovibrio bacteriovorus TaxID=959 RepID=A0A150WNJ6_BDEBC|nr:UDP-2,3-diacylglucosamine diphosphatase [Bdellovibrio bacteriovorus]KYG66052.1 UDP-2,3-diacylglucosamine hydrolase [Bdellovibrio bacteriovorus]